jgi:glutaconate CoA-transferase subunit B
LPGVSREKVIAETGFELLISDHVSREEEPTQEELRALREDVDPWRVVLSRGDSSD